MKRALPKERLVVTGFQPFGDFRFNPSWDVARSLAEAAGQRAHLLPVTFTTAAQFARAHLTAARPIPLFFIHFGLAATRDQICFEHRAKNLRDHRPDNLEQTLPVRLPPQNMLVKKGRPERFCSLDLQAYVEAYNATLSADDDLPSARLSQDCGTYVCNALLYHTLRACEDARKQGQQARGLFIHLPMIDTSTATLLGRRLAPLFLSPPSLSSPSDPPSS